MDTGANATAQISVETLSELSRATTAYHEARPDCFEAARQEYLDVLRKFNQSCGSSGA